MEEFDASMWEESRDQDQEARAKITQISPPLATIGLIEAMKGVGEEGERTSKNRGFAGAMTRSRL